MSALNDFQENFGSPRFIFLIIGFIFFISPGFLATFLFYREIFLSIDFLKLVVLSISFNVPLTFITFASLLMVVEKSEAMSKKPNAVTGDKAQLETGFSNASICFVLAMLVSGFLLDSLLVVGYALGTRLQYLLFGALGIHILLWLFLLFSLWKISEHKTV